MIADLREKVNSDHALVRRGRFLTTTFLLEQGATPWLVSILNGKITSIVRGPFVMPTWSFALRASEQEWSQFWSADPSPGFHDLMALVKRRALKIEGDVPEFMRNLRYFKEALAKLRAEGAQS
jgi:hypothetical protein